jgi:hypothetical protein
MFSQKHRGREKVYCTIAKKEKQETWQKLYLFWSAGKTDQSRMPVFQVILLKNKRGDILKN